MGLTDEVRSMQAQGISQEESVKILQNQGYQMTEISEAFSQAKIKEAVNSPPVTSPLDESNDMQPSILQQQVAQAPSPVQQNPPQQEAQYPQYQYDSYSSGISSDNISEIAEQIMLEQLSPLKNKIEQSLEFRNIIETKMNYIDERLKRIENTIDRLQLSILQKVGEYMTNVQDIKKEIQENQKSFKSMLSKPSLNQ